MRVAVVGLGYWGPNLVRNFVASSRVEIAWLCDRDQGRLDEVGAQYPATRRTVRFEDILADDRVDAVAIATPVATHHALVRAALAAHKHVLVEKPLAASVAQATELVDLAAAAKRVLFVDHVFVHSPAVQKIAELARSGELGELLFFDSVRINLGLFQHDVNVVWDLAPHDLSIIDYLIGRPPRRLVAVGASHARDQAEAVAYLHLDYGNNLLASVHVNWLSPVKVRHFLVGGTRRSVLYNDLDLAERVKVYDRGVDVSADPEGIRRALVSYRSGDVVSPHLDDTEPLRYVVERFADCVENGRAPITGGEQGLRIVKILECAQRSMTAGGVWVNL
jgi:predicted dehydrogenase